MADPEVGALGQDGIVDSNDAKYGGAVHAHHYEKYNVAYDEIAADGGRNRWHVQTYFDRYPYNDCYDTRDGEGVSVDYRFYNPDGSGDTDMDFENWEPKEWMLEDDDYTFTPSFSVGYPITPWLSVSAASVSLDSDGSSSNEVKEDPYNSVEAHVALEYGSALPDSEDPSDGFRTDIVAYRGTGVESLNFSSEFEYRMICNRSYGYYTTGKIDESISVDIV
jgi:hypothetical protein